LNFVKLQATGNDFVLIDARTKERDWAKLAREMCPRRWGVGADGLIVVANSSVADIGMRIFNPDGSEAEVSGNGLRCLAKYVIDRELFSGFDLKVETLSGIKRVETSVEMGKVNKARVGMGMPRFKLEEVPIKAELMKSKEKQIPVPVLDYPMKITDEKLALSFVSIGNPHAVSFVSGSVTAFPLAEVGPKVEDHPLFPERVNFEVARVISHRQIEARVWERGAGETLSCGSGACAVAVIAKLKGYTNSEVDIILSGGTLNVEWDGVGEIWLSGPVTEVFSGEWPR